MVRSVLTRQLVGIAGALLIGGSALGLTTSASARSRTAPDRYASIVIDATSGDVLYTRNADAFRYPASLTKMMTLYMTFEALKAGTLSLDRDLTASSHAAAQAPSKLHLKSGDKISVDDAIRAVVTKSANDVAVVLAEQLGGDEKSFAKLMTAKAHSLGMDRTTFRNASGLPNPNQRTTARDLATLGVALKRDFPEYYSYFATPNFTWNGVTYPNHDKLLDKYEGTTGLKTGYTAASGFNLATAVSRAGHDLIAVVMGGRTARARDDHMMQLLDLQFARLKGGPIVADAGPSSDRSRPAVSGQVAELTTTTTTTTATTADAKTTTTTVRQTASAATPRPRPNSSRIVTASLAPSGDPIGDTIAALTAKPKTEVQAPVEPVQVATAEMTAEGDTDAGDPQPLDAKDASVISWLGGNQAHAWGIQIGAFAAMESAAARLSAAAALAPEHLANASPAILPSANGRSTLYRARFGPFDQAQAQSACNALNHRGITCTTVHDSN